jgi:hypothetical protein
MVRMAYQCGTWIEMIKVEARATTSEQGIWLGRHLILSKGFQIMII